MKTMKTLKTALYIVAIAVSVFFLESKRQARHQEAATKTVRLLARSMVRTGSGSLYAEMTNKYMSIPFIK